MVSFPFHGDRSNYLEFSAALVLARGGIVVFGSDQVLVRHCLAVLGCLIDGASPTAAVHTNMTRRLFALDKEGKAESCVGEGSF